MALATLLLLTNAFSVSAAELTALSTWQNQSGSTFAINSVDPSTGLLTGTYINRASGTGCQNTPYQAVGYLTGGNLLSWSVQWINGQANCNSVTGWTGYYQNGQITTKWNLAYFTSSSGAIQSGADVFTRVSQKSTMSLIQQ
jgi:hypothetical protein